MQCHMKFTPIKHAHSTADWSTRKMSLLLLAVVAMRSADPWLREMQTRYGSCSGAFKILKSPQNKIFGRCHLAPHGGNSGWYDGGGGVI